MNNKTCGECIHFDSESNMCCLYYDHFVEAYDNTVACEDFEPEPKPMTNGDKVRAMNNEELAELLADNTCTDCGFFVINQDGTEGCTMTTKETCKDGKLAWLNAPAGK